MTDHDTERKRQADFARQARGPDAPTKASDGGADHKREFSATFNPRSDRKVIARIQAAIQASGLKPNAWVARALDRASAAELNQARQQRRGE